MTDKAIRSYKTFNTNIKGLPEGEYITETGYSDSKPWKVISKTASSMKIVQVLVKKDPDWKPVMLPGGFSAHCSNQEDQTWIFDKINEAHVRTVRLKKSKYYGSDKLWGDKYGQEFIANGARSFYDYNF